MTEPTHQLVVQFPEAAVPDFDALVRSEDLLIEVLGDRHVVDGHDIGSGSVNFFIHTADRAAVLQAIQAGTDWLAHPDVRIATRKLQGADQEYRTLWPQGDKRDFRYGFRSSGSAEAASAPVTGREESPGEQDTTSVEPETLPFLPLTNGAVPGTRYRHRVQHLGRLRIPSGRLEASDPFVNLGRSNSASRPGRLSRLCHARGRQRGSGREPHAGGLSQRRDR